MQAEAALVLLVDHSKGQGAEADVGANDGVRADQDVQFTGLQRGKHLAPIPGTSLHTATKSTCRWLDIAQFLDRDCQRYGVEKRQTSHRMSA